MPSKQVKDLIVEYATGYAGVDAETAELAAEYYLTHNLISFFITGDGGWSFVHGALGDKATIVHAADLQRESGAKA